MNKYILITGVNGYLAKKILHHITSTTDFEVIGLDVHGEKDEITIDSYNLGLKFYSKCDLRNEKSIIETVNMFAKKNILPAVLINNAAIDSVPKNDLRATGLEFESFNDMFSVNVKAPVILAKYLSDYWVKNKILGNIINISSIYSIVSPDPSIYSNGFIKNIFYGASKAALNSTTHQLAVIFAKSGIRVNTLLLGGIVSDKQDDFFQMNYKGRIPIRRFLEVDEIFDAINMLLSEKNTYMTGAIISLDGGYTSI
jgi:NAD(P)-dependent dehydrogenase (short-subunit alcohol dehydrogenase family)